jgi:hypothetical protein
MNMKHVRPFLDAMHSKASAAVGEHLSPDVVLHSPFVTKPFIGRSAVVGILKVLLSGVDEFVATAIIADESRAAIVLRIRAGETQVTGVDDLSVDADGFISSMSVQWRPLEAVVTIQQKLARLIGVPALELVEKRAANSC